MFDMGGEASNSVSPLYRVPFLRGYTSVSIQSTEPLFGARLLGWALAAEPPSKVPSSSPPGTCRAALPTGCVQLLLVLKSPVYGGCRVSSRRGASRC